MVNATLRLWVDHPYNARFTKNVRGKLAVASKVQRILQGLEEDGWTAEYEEQDEDEICWVACRSFNEDEDPVLACLKRNPNRWGTLVVVDERHGEEIEVW